ncbi:hypothetical protein AGMMS49928_15390 [Spirochaetia bacterium]|nr:hypothetical protein AGMMS49928_15390 [Spirochaetia bacterium]
MSFKFCRLRFIFLTLIFAASVFNCSALSKDGIVRLETRELKISRSGAPPVAVKTEIARTAAERERGLMYRKEVPDGEAMLFVFEKDQILSFWMKDTLVPLSIAFISADGRILEIRPLEPGNLRSVHSTRSARYALEVNRDWFTRAGISVGDMLELKF